jgi:tungstate transport system ATP-binding protein
MSNWLFELEGVGLRLGRVQALQGCSLRIAAGERVALVGANGSGKSSLLRCLHGLLVPTEGRMARTPGRQAGGGVEGGQYPPGSACRGVAYREHGRVL